MRDQGGYEGSRGCMKDQGVKENCFGHSPE